MALYTNYSLFVDVENGVASKSFQDVNQLVGPAFFKGDQSVLNVYFVKPNNYGSSPYEEVIISGLASVNVAIGTSSAVATSTSGLTALGAASLGISTVVAYASGTNQIDRVTISPAPKAGTFALLYNSLPIGPISIFASAAEFQAALELNASLTDKVTVNKVGDFTWDITYDSTLAPPLSLGGSGSGIVSFTGYEVVLDMTAAGVATLLAGAASAEATLEISTTQTTGSYVQTAAQIPCTVYEDIL